MKKNNSTCCLIFTKNPIPGKTKTRLIPELGINGAYEVHLKLLNHTIKTATKIKNIDFILYCTSKKNNELLLSLASKNNLMLKIQKGDNLGGRMFQASHESLNNYSHCIIIGTDCPELTDNYIIEAKKALTSGYDAVIGPAYDGGYVLIGFNNATKTIFSNITWGENTVLTSTVRNFNKMNIKYKKLPTLHDVDIKEDLQYIKFNGAD